MKIPHVSLCLMRKRGRVGNYMHVRCTRQREEENEIASRQKVREKERERERERKNNKEQQTETARLDESKKHK